MPSHLNVLERRARRRWEAATESIWTLLRGASDTPPASLFATAFVLLLVDRGLVRGVSLRSTLEHMRTRSDAAAPAPDRRTELARARGNISYSRNFDPDCITRAIRAFEEEPREGSGPHGFLASRHNVVAVLDEFWEIGKTLSEQEIDTVMQALAGGCKNTPRRRCIVPLCNKRPSIETAMFVLTLA